MRQENLVCCLGDDDGRRRRDGVDDMMGERFDLGRSKPGLGKDLRALETQVPIIDR